MFNAFVLFWIFNERAVQMIFLRPWLLLLIFLPIVFVFIRAKRQKGGAWKNEVDSHLLPHLIHSFDITKKKKTGGFLFFLWLVACVCLSGPAFEKKTSCGI